MKFPAPHRPWYAGGLAFECIRCGRCCAGPEEGYVWISGPEIAALAQHLRLSEAEMYRRYLRRVGRRYTLIEHPQTKDCIFLARDAQGQRFCAIYALRPAQCRTWPFWASNLDDTDSWAAAGGRCPGVNRGPLHEHDEIERKRQQTTP